MEAAKELQQVYFTPEQPILHKGERGDIMYLIGHGQVEVHDGPRHIAQLSDGQFFGELALIGEETRGADVTAVSHCDLFVLTRQRFQDLMAHHPDLQGNVHRIAAQRQAVAS
jgi:voltage-gated potassium channel